MEMFVSICVSVFFFGFVSRPCHKIGSFLARGEKEEEILYSAYAVDYCVQCRVCVGCAGSGKLFLRLAYRNDHAVFGGPPIS